MPMQTVNVLPSQPLLFQKKAIAADRGAMLRAELAALGPVAVKLGQTLSQRPDILPDDVCEALKALQTTNAPFPDEEAFRVIAEDFNATGPVAPGLPLLDGYDPEGPTLFKSLSATCIASASLGQVYKGETHDGRPIAVKVQRPGALRQCLLDGSVIIVALKAIQGRCARNSAQFGAISAAQILLRNSAQFSEAHPPSAATGTATSWRSSTRWRRAWCRSSTSATRPPTAWSLRRAWASWGMSTCPTRCPS